MTPFLFMRYIIRLFMGRAIFIATALSSILLIFDVLANAATVTENHTDVLKPLLVYAVLRLPNILDLILPLTALFAALGTIYQTVATQELIAIRASGLSALYLTSLFLTSGIFICLFHFALSNTIQPYTAGLLAEWERFDYAGMPPENPKLNSAGWISVGNTLLQVGDASSDGKTLTDLHVVARDGDGVMIDYFTATRGLFYNDGWTFYQIHRPDFGRNISTTIPELRIGLPIKPKIFATLVDTPEQLNLLQLHRLGQERVMQKQPSYIYQLWFHRKIAYPLSSFLMILLAMPLAFKLSRAGGSLKMASVIFVAGFAFIILERLLQTLGADGALSPLLAAWSPLMLFTVLGSWAVLMQDS